MRQLLDIPNDTLVIAVIANLVSYKGHRDLLDALALVKEQIAPTVACSCDRSRRRHRRGAQAPCRGVEHCRTISGGSASNRQPIACLPRPTFSFCPRIKRAFPMLYWRPWPRTWPSIATAVGGNLDAIVDNKSGILVPPRDPIRFGGRDCARCIRFRRSTPLRRRGASPRRAAIYASALRRSLREALSRDERTGSAACRRSPDG